MHISILTLFPEMFVGPFDHSIIQRAKDKQLVDIHFVNMRDFSTDRHKTVDDRPYGGGAGMILRVDIVDKAITHAKHSWPGNTRTILLDPQGTPFAQPAAQRLAAYDHIILVSGHYEGVDERTRTLVDEELSIGDFVVTGGEIPTMALVDAVTRLIPGVLSKSDATVFESFSQNSDGERLLEYPQYTKPLEYQGMAVPPMLLSGNHKEIAEWRKTEAKEKTKTRRKDLLKSSG